MTPIDVLLILKLGRFHFLFAGFFAFTAGALLAVFLGAPFSLDRYILGYLVLMPAHLSVSYSNDYFDVEADQYGQPTLFTGGSGVLVEHPHLRPVAKKIALFLISVSILLSLIFTILYQSPLFFLISLVGLFLAWFYSAPPLRLSYRGWGEWAMISTGFIIPALGYLSLRGYLDWDLFIFTIPLLFYQLFFIMSVEIPDREGDIKGGKNNYVALNNRNKAFKLVAIGGSIPTLLYILFAISGWYPAPDFWIVSIISLLPAFFGIYAYLNRTEDKIIATKLATFCLSSLFLYVLLVNLYFVYSLFWL